MTYFSLPDPVREVVVQRTNFTPLQGQLDEYPLFALLAPHLCNSGAGNSACLGDHKLAGVGISNETLAADLQRQGTSACAKSWDDLMNCLGLKSKMLAKGS